MTVLQHLLAQAAPQPTDVPVAWNWLLAALSTSSTVTFLALFVLGKVHSDSELRNEREEKHAVILQRDKLTESYTTQAFPLMQRIEEKMVPAQVANTEAVTELKREMIRLVDVIDAQGRELSRMMFWLQARGMPTWPSQLDGNPPEGSDKNS